MSAGIEGFVAFLKALILSIMKLFGIKPTVDDYTAGDPVDGDNTELELEYKFLPTNHRSGGQIQYRGIALGGDGNLHCIPYYNDFIISIDLDTDNVLKGPSVSHIPRGRQRWVDCVEVADGSIIANCHSAYGHLHLQFEDNQMTVDRIKTNRGGYISYGMQTRGGAIVDDKLYSTTYSGGGVVKVVNANEGVYIGNMFYTPDRTGPIYDIRPNWERENTGNLFDTYWGAVAGNNKKVYGIPFGSDRILIIDSKTQKAVQGVDTLTGGHSLPTTQPLHRSHPYFLKYNGGTLSTINNCIYSFGRKARTILKIDTQTDRAREIMLPADVIEYAEANNLSIAFSSFEGPDGRIYSVPWQLPYMLWIDPRTDEVGYIDLTDILTKDNIDTTFNYFTYARRVGESVYFSPGSSNAVLKITFKNY